MLPEASVDTLLGTLLFDISSVPVVAFKPKTYRMIDVITVIKIKGINTIIQDTTFRPL